LHQVAGELAVLVVELAKVLLAAIVFDRQNLPDEALLT